MQQQENVRVVPADKGERTVEHPVRGEPAAVLHHQKDAAVRQHYPHFMIESLFIPNKQPFSKNTRIITVGTLTTGTSFPAAPR